MALVTAPSLQTARALARAALEARLIACANLVRSIESHYRWQGRLERSSEVLVLMKTTTRRLAALERLVLDRHPYDTPEFIVAPLHAGATRYLNWIIECCASDGMAGVRPRPKRPVVAPRKPGRRVA